MVWNYLFWLVLVSLFCFVLERLFPWRKQQVLRPEFLQDLFWIVFNGYLFGLLFQPVFVWIYGAIDGGYAAFSAIGPYPRFLGSLSLPVQVVLFLVYADFFEWCIHNLLHRIGFLWRFHRVHHSIVTMDWIGNFRFHWFEIIVYNLLKYIPLALAGGDWRAIFIAGVISTLVGHLNHSNLKISWGPLRYLFNSPAMHIWHHDRELRGRAGVNFAVVFSLWDWMFGTAYMPRGEQPRRLGYQGDQRVSRSLLSRFFIPFYG